jgi:hypothetical protein
MLIFGGQDRSGQQTLYQADLTTSLVGKPERVPMASGRPTARTGLRGMSTNIEGREKVLMVVVKREEFELLQFVRSELKQ